MADGPRCKRRKQANPRRNNGEWRRGPARRRAAGGRARGPGPSGPGAAAGPGRVEWESKVVRPAASAAAAAAAVLDRYVLPASAPSGSAAAGTVSRAASRRRARPLFRPRVERLLLLSSLSPLLLPPGASPRAILPPRRPRRRGTNLRRAGAGCGAGTGRRGRAAAGRLRVGCVSAVRACARERALRAGSGARGKVAPRALAGGRGWGRAGLPRVGRSGGWNPAPAVPVGGRARSGGSVLLPRGVCVRGLAACGPGNGTDRSGHQGSPSPGGHRAVCMRLALALSVWGSCYLGPTREQRTDNGTRLALGVASGAGGGGGGRLDGRTGLRLAVQLRWVLISVDVPRKHTPRPG